ncbi:hypothetical protein JCM11491_001323 [Sporobolomyces phaffii]
MNQTADPPGESVRPVSRDQLPPPIPLQHALQPPPPPPHYSVNTRPSSRSASPFPEHMQQYATALNPLLPPPPPPPMQHRTSGQRSHSPYSVGQLQDTRTQLFVSNLPFRVRWQDLKDLMRKCGTVLRADVALSATDGRSRGFGVVLFARAEDAAKAIGVYHGYTWQTRVLDVRIDSQDPTGALALAEANRQQAIQQQREVYQNLASRMPPGAAPLNLPPPPPILQPLSNYTSNGGYQHVPTPPPPPPLPVQHQHNSPFLAPTHLSSPSRGSSSPLAHHSSPFLHSATQVHLQGHPDSQMRSSSSSGDLQSHPSPYLNETANPSPLLPAGPNSSESIPSSSSRTPQRQQPSGYSSPSLLSHESSSSTPHSPATSVTSPRAPSVAPSPVVPNSDLPFASLDRSDSASRTRSRPEAAMTPPPQLFPTTSSNRALHHLDSNHPRVMPPPPPPPVSSQVPTMMVPGGLLNFYSLNGSAGGNQMLGQGMNGGGGAPRANMHQPGGGTMGVGMGMGPGQGAIGYTNRHLFIGNLPFNCQWQELKDLMRGAGSVLRADIAQGPDGRSRGFGSVLFATSIDAERAVHLFNGHEFQGRTLKVHFDKFSGAGVGQPGSNYPNGGPPPGSAYSNGTQGGGPGYRPDGPQYPNQYLPHPPTREQPRPPPPPANYLASRPQSSQQQQQPYGLTSQFANSPTFQGFGETVGRESSSGSSRPGTAQAPIGSPSPRVLPRDAPAPSESSPTARESNDAPSAALAYRPVPDETGPRDQAKKPSTSPSLLRQNAAAPSRIAMPPPLPFSSASGGPFSPMRANLPPMTPSMPAFTFGGFSAPTPPVHPHALFSPGIGPFSPQMGSPFFGPGQAMNHFQTVAPGAPSPGFGFNPMFPAFPPTPNGAHHSQQSMQQRPPPNGYPINGNGNGHAAGDDHPTPLASQAPDTTIGDASYFPRVASLPSPPGRDSSRDHQQEGAGRPQPESATGSTRTPLARDLDEERGGERDAGRTKVLEHSVSGTLAIDLARRMRIEDEGEGGGRDQKIFQEKDRLHHRRNSSAFVVGGVIAQPGWAEEDAELESAEETMTFESEERRSDEKGVKQGRRKSFVPPTAEGTSATGDEPVAGGSPGKLKAGESGSLSTRRASFEDSVRSRPALGSSIWG